MRKILIITLLSSAIPLTAQAVNNNEYPNTVPVLGAVKAAVETPPDILAGVAGKSIYKGEEENRVPVLGAVEAASEGAANIVTSFFGWDIHKGKKTETNTEPVTEEKS